MRTLTIKRAKKYVGCLGKAKIYIEDHVSGDTEINKVPCRKIGELKNGEEKSFQIDTQAAKIFVIGDKLSKNFSNDFFELPAGVEDVYLSGQNKYNPATGNAFVFDNNSSEDALSNRKRNLKKGIVVLLIAAVIGGAWGFFSNFINATPSEKVFSADGMEITLTNEFFKMYMDGYNATFGTADVVVLALKEDYEFFEDSDVTTIEEYAELVFETNELDGYELTTENGLSYFSYDAQDPETEDVYTYISYVYASDDAFWIIQFAAKAEDIHMYAQQIPQWASTVTFE